MDGPTTERYFAITASFMDGSGEPDVLLVTNCEDTAKAYLGMIERAEPMKVVRITTPAAVILVNAQRHGRGEEK